MAGIIQRHSAAPPRELFDGVSLSARESTRKPESVIVAQNTEGLISEITVAVKNGVGLRGIGNTLHPCPAQAEAICSVGDPYSRSRVALFIPALFGKWLRRTC